MNKNKIKKFLSMIGTTTLVASPIVAMGGGLLSNNPIQVNSDINKAEPSYIMCNEWERGTDEFGQTTWTWTDPSDSSRTIVLIDSYDQEKNPNGGLHTGNTVAGEGTIDITNFDGKNLYYLDLSSIECNKLDEAPYSNIGLRNCNAIYGIKLPKTIDIITAAYFQNCSNLQEIEMPGVKYIERKSFQNCTSLQELTLPEGYEVLDTYDSSNQQYNNDCTWLAQLTSLTKITLPSTLTTIASNAFVGLSSLQEVVFTNNTIDLTMNGTTFGSNSSSLKLYFNNEELKNTYSSYIQGSASNNYGWDTCGLTYSETLVDVNPTPPTPEPSYEDPIFSSFTAKNEKINTQPSTANNDGLELGSFSITNFSNIDTSALKLGTKITSWNASTAVQDGLKLEIVDQGSGKYKVMAKWADNAFTTEEVISFQYEITNNDNKVVSSDETTYTITVSNDVPVDPSNPSNTNIGLIAGIAGGVVGAILLIVIIVLIAKKSKQRKVLY